MGHGLWQSTVSAWLTVCANAVRRWSGHHEVRPQPIEAGEEGALLGVGRPVEDQVQNPVSVLPRVSQRGGAIPAPQGWSVPREGERRQVGCGSQRQEHRQERQPRGDQVRRQARLRFVDITLLLCIKMTPVL